MKKIVFTLFTLAYLLSSCSTDEFSLSDYIVGLDSYSISVDSSDNINFSYIGEKKTVTIKASQVCSWKVVSAIPEWLSVNVVEGQGSQEIVFSASQNSSVFEREAEISIEASDSFGKYSKRIQFKQEGEPAYFKIEGSLDSIPARGEVLLAPTNMDNLSINLNENWIKQEEDNGIIKFLVKENLTDQERVASIVISHPKASRIEYKIRQLPYFIKTSHSELIASYSMTNYSYIYVNSDADWLIENNYDWMRVSRFPDNTGHIIQIQVDNNDDRNERKASISLVSRKNPRINADIMITQHSKYYFGEEYVDLGLPSGTLWAVKNIGASDISDPGWRFGWGETEPKDSVGNYDNIFYDRGTQQFTKYVLDERWGKIDSLEYLEAIDDAASQLLGGEWRIPTIQDVSEIEKYVKKDYRKDYYKYYSDLNGESIIFPTGYGGLTDYWTNTLYKQSIDAYTLNLVNRISLGHLGRINTAYIRPVFKFEKRITWPTLQEIERVQNGNIKIENYEEDENWN